MLWRRACVAVRLQDTYSYSEFQGVPCVDEKNIPVDSLPYRLVDTSRGGGIDVRVSHELHSVYCGYEALVILKVIIPIIVRMWGIFASTGFARRWRDV